MELPTLREGLSFTNYKDLETFISDYERRYFTILWKLDTRTIESARKRCTQKNVYMFIFYGVKI